MSAYSLYPLKFSEIYIEKPWGGRRLRTLLDKKLPSGKKIGECWEISDWLEEGSEVDTRTRVKNGPWTHKRLDELVQELKQDLVGDEIWAKYKNEFPLLVKFIDANERLSLQVHPEGKTEAWYIVEAQSARDRQRGAQLFCGLKEGVTKEALRQAIEAKDNEGVENLLRSINVTKGDVIFIPAGTVHALGKGILVLEIQQRTQITFRLYDWGRPRKIHLREGLRATNFGPEQGGKVSQVSWNKQANKRQPLIRCQYFSLEFLGLREPLELSCDPAKFQIFCLVNGTGRIQYGKDETVEIKKGECLLLPAHLGDYEIVPEKPCEIIIARP